ncbi:MAG: transcription termination factor NusA [Gemmatimonadota bacterium]
MANAGQIVAAFRDVAETKSLSDEEMTDLVKDGIMAGLARIYGPNVRAEIDIDEDTGEFDIVVLKRVVEEVEDPSCEISLEEARWDDETYEVGDVMEVPVDFADFGRNAVMAVKQRIVQRVRENERDRIRDEFEGRVGELLSGEVQQIERGKIVVLLNRARDADALIPWKDQNPRERFRQGDPIRAVLKKVEETPKGPRLILSRADPLFVAALFKLEVPEIYQGIVEIKEIAREVGGRTKIAVYSRDDSIDPVGACVGLKGSRVQAVVSELGGERIDIVPWHPDPEVFARRALAPARVAKVLSDPERRVITAIVDEDQLSLAIGRNGQNVRLASQLIGWQIDLYGSREWLERGADLSLFNEEGGEEYETADFPISELEISETALAALNAAGYDTFLQIIDLERGDFLAIPGLSEEDANRLLQLIDELTVIEEPTPAAEAPAEGGEAAGIFGLTGDPPATEEADAVAGEGAAAGEVEAASKEVEAASKEEEAATVEAEEPAEETGASAEEADAEAAAVAEEDEDEGEA